MIHAHSLGRAARYYGERTALASGTTRPTFRELHDRVAGIAAALGGHGFQAGDRLAMLLPNEHDSLELVAPPPAVSIGSCRCIPDSCEPAPANHRSCVPACFRGSRATTGIFCPCR